MTNGSAISCEKNAQNFSRNFAQIWNAFEVARTLNHAIHFARLVYFYLTHAFAVCRPSRQVAAWLGLAFGGGRGVLSANSDGPRIARPRRTEPLHFDGLLADQSRATCRSGISRDLRSLLRREDTCSRKGLRLFCRERRRTSSAARRNVAEVLFGRKGEISFVRWQRRNRFSQTCRARCARRDDVW